MKQAFSKLFIYVRFSLMEKNELDFRELLFSYLKHWKWFVLSIVITFFADFYFEFANT